MTKLLILAAGRGSRLKNLTNEVPKCMVEFEGRAIIDWQLERVMKLFNPKDIAVMTGYKSEILRDYIGNISPYISILHNPRWMETNMVSSLIAARNWNHDDLIIAYSDIIYDPKILDDLMQSKADSIVIPSNQSWKKVWECRFENPLEDLETFVLDSNNSLLEIGKKPTDYSQIQGQFMGIAYFPKAKLQEVLNLLNSKGTDLTDKLDFTSMINMLIQNGYNISTINHNSYWLEIDSEDDIRQYSGQGFISEII
ncbi:MAG: phosphocholine cytidylyltransferase family protein [Alphaproteobacteria bacterium]|nr:phosphocholine cytidylyltransferase family protein [Alphaproteobacteria bacterium]OJV16064.1 MAG: hypothetical protein BGO27_04375 [Alphaproteobacteria bacterium 33-17]